MLDENTIARIYHSNKLQYHNWAHISSMLVNAERLFKDSLDVESFELLRQAILFHDIVYVPGAPDNEEKSAKAFLIHQVKTPVESPTDSPARKLLSAVPLPVETPEHPVVSMIMATKSHKPPKADFKTTELAKILIDLDLLGLGDSWDNYRAVGMSIRLEFAEAGFTDEQFDSGRKDFIRRFLERDKIFQTEFFEDRELRAIYNLKKELYLLNIKGL